MLRCARVRRLLVARPFAHAATRVSRGRVDATPSPTQANATPSSVTRRVRFARALDVGDAHALLATVVRALAHEQRARGGSRLCGGDDNSVRSDDGADALAQVMLSAPYAHAEATMRVLCACVGVCVPVTHWPPWLRATLRSRSGSSGSSTRHATQSLLATVRCIPTCTAAATTNNNNNNNNAAAATPPPLHAIALSVLRAVMTRIGSSQRTRDEHDEGSEQTATQRLLRRVALLCLICIAPSHEAAVALARRALVSSSSSSSDNDDTNSDASVQCGAAAATQPTHSRRTDTAAAVGQALRAYYSVFACVCTARERGATAPPLPPSTLEAWWLQTWRSVNNDEVAATAAAAAVPAPTASSSSSSSSRLLAVVRARVAGMDAATLQQEHVAWLVHVLLAHAHYDAVVHTLRTAATNDDDDDTDAACAMTTTAVLLRLPAVTRAAMLACMPLSTLYAHAPLHDVLAQSLLTPHASLLPQATTTTTTTTTKALLVSRTTPMLSLVATDAVLYARVLHSALTQCLRCITATACTAALRVLHSVLTCSNADTLLASLLPPSRPLESVMLAQHDRGRATRAHTLVSALQRCLSVLCHDGGSNNDDNNSKDNTDNDDSCSAVAVAVATTALPCRAVDVWRQTVVLSCATTAAVADAVVGACARVCAALLTRSARRATALPLRRAMPPWRRALCERTALRAHKYELLLSELPHRRVCDALAALLRGGYVREACDVGACLLRHERVDLTYYSLPLLGSLHQALLWHSTQDNDDDNNNVNNKNNDDDVTCARVDVFASDAERRQLLRQLRELYLRRRDVFGDDDSVLHTPHVHDAATGPPPPADAAAVPTAVTTTSRTLAVQTTMLAGVIDGKVVPHAALVHYIRCLLDSAPLRIGGGGVALDTCSSSTSSSAARVFAPWRCSGRVCVSP